VIDRGSGQARRDQPHLLDVAQILLRSLGQPGIFGGVRTVMLNHDTLSLAKTQYDG